VKLAVFTLVVNMPAVAVTVPEVLTNGAKELLVAVPVLVTVKLLVELSVKKPAPLTVFNNKLVLVPVMAALGLPF
jgi:hypothetical protein